MPYLMIGDTYLSRPLFRYFFTLQRILSRRFPFLSFGPPRTITNRALARTPNLSCQTP